MPEIATDPRFATNPQRIANRPKLVEILVACLTKRTSAYWIELLESRAVPCGPINRIDQVFEDPQVVSRGMKRILTEGQSQPLPVVANPVKMAGHETTAAKAPPLLGEDTEGVMRSVLGLDEEEIAALKRARTIG